MEHEASETSVDTKFTLTWSITSTTDLDKFIAVISSIPVSGHTQRWRTQRVPPNLFNSTISLPFYSEVNVSIVAIFKAANSSVPIPRHSVSVRRVTGVGPPSPPSGMTHRFQDEILTLWWIPPGTPNGPIDHFILKITDPTNSTNQRKQAIFL